MIKEILILLAFFSLIYLMVWTNGIMVFKVKTNNFVKMGYALLSSAGTLAGVYLLFTFV